MSRILAGALCLSLLASAGTAQTPAEVIAEAQQLLEAEEWREALELLLPLVDSAAKATEHEQIAGQLDAAAAGSRAAGDSASALRAYRTALAMRKRSYGDEDHPDLARNLNNVANCLHALARWGEALPLYEQALAMRKRLHGDDDHRDVAVSLNNLALCLQLLGRSADALPQFEQSLAMKRRFHGERDHHDVAGTLHNLASCLRSLGRPGEGLPLSEQALAMRTRLHRNRDHLDVAESLNGVGHCLLDLGRWGEAMRQFEQTLAMGKRLLGDRDHPQVATSLNNMATCLMALGRSSEALAPLEQALAMRTRLHGGRDHPEVAASLNNVANCRQRFGRAGDALPLFEQALAMRKRLFGDRDHPDVANSLGNMGYCLHGLGRSHEAVPHYEQALAMRRRLYGDRDHPAVAQDLNNLAACLTSLGRFSEALPHAQQAMAVGKRLYGDKDHPDVATSLGKLASCLHALGRTSEALPQYEQALAMQQRLFGDRDHPELAGALRELATCLYALGRGRDALPRFQQSLAMHTRLHGDRDHPDVAGALNNLAGCFHWLGYRAEALPRFEQALAMKRRLYADQDHPEVARGLNNVGGCLQALGRSDDALPLLEQALAMRRRLHGDRDHPGVADGLNNVAGCFNLLGRPSEALPLFEQALAMQQRLHGDRDHPDVAQCLNNLSVCLELLGRREEAVRPCAEACDAIERLREQSVVSADLKQSLFDALKRGGAFDRLQALTAQREPAFALAAAERSRGRELLDLMEQQRFDPLGEAEQRASRRGDEAAAAGLHRLRAELGSAFVEGDRLLHELSQLDAADARAELLARLNANAARLRQLQDERARRLSDVLPVGRVRSATEIQSALRDGEVLLEFTITANVGLVYLVSRRTTEAFALPTAHATIGRVLSGLLAQVSRERSSSRGRDPGEAASPSADVVAAGRELFASLVPTVVWERVAKARRVFLAAHRALHRLPFELLVTDVLGGKPVYWLDGGPPISYVPSGSALHWLRKRATEAGDDATSLDLLAVGDPGGDAAEALTAAAPDVLRSGDLERIQKLPPLRGARAETAAITKVFADRHGTTKLLLGPDANEPAVFGLASKAKFVHFACHGIAEEYAGQSLSMLVLSLPRQVLPADDGLLKLTDLLDAWRGRLASCRLVVLSACRTNVGPTRRDEAPQALPLGFLFAGAPSVISSLWAVDDASTRELMVDFYSRSLGDDEDRLKALTDAKKQLRAKHPDPFHWAPFLFLGSPE